MIPEADPDMITYLTELLRTNKPVHQNNSFWFPTPGNPGNIDDLTPIQTRILKELRVLQLKQKLNPKDDAESPLEITTTKSERCQMQHNTWQRSHNSASLTAPKLITSCRWQTNVRWKNLPSILPAEPLPTRDLHKVSADLCLLLQASCASTWTRMCSIRGRHWNCSQ